MLFQERQSRTCSVCNTESRTETDQKLLNVQRPAHGSHKFSDLVTARGIASYKCESHHCRERPTGSCQQMRQLIFPERCKYLLINMTLFSDMQQRSAASVTGFHQTLSIGITRWSVVATVHHHGQSPQHGHYLCVRRVASGELVCADDTRSTPRQRFQAANAVMVFLRKLE